VPTVLRVGAFHVIIFLPPREHAPPHVHVRTAGGEVVIELAVEGRMQSIRTVAGMRNREVAAAFRVVEEQAELLLACWRRYHA